MNLTKSGMISIVGRPNVGKSTLTNALVGEKIAIVTNKPQTTRNRICAVLNRGECQYVFMDTPGLHKARTRLGEYMVGVVKESVADVDAVMLLIEPIPHVGGPEAELIARIRALGVPAVLVINKIDTVEKEELLPFAYGAKGIGEIATIPTAPAAQGAYYARDHILRTSLPMQDTFYKKPAKKAAP